MKLKELIKDLQVLACTADPELEIGGVSYDSRQTRKGDLFVAIRGFASDGHRFIPMAAEMGAAAVLCEEEPSIDIPYVKVADCRYGLAIASRNFFARIGKRAGRQGRPHRHKRQHDRHGAHAQRPHDPGKL